MVAVGSVLFLTRHFSDKAEFLKQIDRRCGGWKTGFQLLANHLYGEARHHGQQFRAPDFDEMALRMPGKLIVDGRNLYQPAKMQASGWGYVSVGRAAVTA